MLEDLTGGLQGDALGGCSVDDAASVLGALAPFHARWWERSRTSGFPPFGGAPQVRQEAYESQRTQTRREREVRHAVLANGRLLAAILDHDVGNVLEGEL